MASMIAFGGYDVVLGSRILGGGAVKGGMPVCKYVANRFLTAFQNIFTGAKLSEYHTGFRAYSRQVLTDLPLLENSKILTTSFLVMKCSPNAFSSITALVRFPARQGSVLDQCFSQC
jgi:hypothetical protein